MCILPFIVCFQFKISHQDHDHDITLWQKSCDTGHLYLPSAVSLSLWLLFKLSNQSIAYQDHISTKHNLTVKIYAAYMLIVIVFSTLQHSGTLLFTALNEDIIWPYNSPTRPALWSTSDAAKVAIKAVLL